MKVYPECLPCFALQALRAANQSTHLDTLKWEILIEACKHISTFHPGMKPVEMAEVIYPLISQKTGVSDPFASLKHETNRQALALYPFFKALVMESKEPIKTALKLSIIGNSIDFGVPHNHLKDLKAETLATLHEPLAINNTGDFLNLLSHASSLLLLADNSGEIVLDRLLLETIHATFTHLVLFIGVREIPIINDVTLEDIKEVGFPPYIRAVSSGNRTPGVILKKSSREFLDLYNTSDIILSKGQGNYEGLSDDADQRVFFLFRAKCAIIAKHVGVREGAMIVKRGGKDDNY